jgi:hypothetical protein
LTAGELDLGFDARLYGFLSTEGIPDRQDHAELGIFRLKLAPAIADRLELEVHGLLQASAPPAFAGASIASGTTRRLFDLETTVIDDPDLLVTAELDRLALRWDGPGFRLVAGRQAITWGVAYFWPVLDLFAPFAPQRIDRDYKAGVDAVRATIPLGDFSEVDVVAAGQGDDLPDDFSAAVLARLHFGLSDFGLMAGSFHTDSVVGGFVTTDVRGTGLRAELALTDSGDARDAEIDRERFVRATFGVDRQLTGTLTLTGEVAWNGFGADDADDYAWIAGSDRVRRGEVTSLGRRYAGASLAWQLHPLVNCSAAVLANLGDGSVLLQPTASWSVSDAVSALFGLYWGVGDDLDPDGRLGSEFGGVPLTVWASVQAFF